MDLKKRIDVAFRLVGLGVVLWIAALPWTAVTYEGGGLAGWYLALFGWMGATMGKVPAFGWYAQVLALLCPPLMTARNEAVRGLAVVVGLFVVVLAVSSYFALPNMAIPKDKAGVNYYGAFVSFGPAIHFWFCSMLVVGLAPCATVVKMAGKDKAKA